MARINTPEGQADLSNSEKYKKSDDRNYRTGVAYDVESVATNAKSMTGKDASHLTNRQVRQANNEMDNVDRRERYRADQAAAENKSGKDAGELGKPYKEYFK